MALIDNIVSYWKFDETTGTTAVDSAGVNNGTLQAGTTFTAGKLNNCITQNSASSVGIDAGTGNSLDFTQYPLSMSSWFKTSYNSTVPNGRMMILSVQIPASPYDRYTLSVDPITGYLYITYSNTTNYLLATTTAYNDGLWHLVVGTISSTGVMRLYIDGILFSSTVTASGTLGTGKKVTIGINWDISTNNPWYGQIDELGIWSRALTSTEVTELYNGGAGIQYPFSPPVTVHPSFLLNFLT